MQKKNHIFLQLKKITEVTTLSFLLFYILLPGISSNLYLGIYAAAILILYFAAGDYRNTEILQEFLIAGVFATIGFLISKFANGCTVADIWNNKSWFRFLLLETCIAEYIVFWLLQMKSQKEQQLFHETSASMKLFPTRESDLERLSLYLSEVDAVGINGTWGSGKTFLADQYIERNQDKYEVIKVEPLTCNMSAIDSYLFQQLEKVLRANRIYPRYSRKLQRALSENAWGKQFNSIFGTGENDQVTEFQGFCQDLDKLDHKVLLVYEDIDRISGENREQIARLFDLTQKMISHNVKVIYQFDLGKMADLDFNRDYLEKYIPYIINLTEISVKDILIEALEELKYVNAGLNWGDFRFLFEVPIVDYYFGREFNLPLQLKYRVENVTPRKLKAFVTEVNTIMQQPEFSNKENRNTVIAFFFMKHFFDNLYQELPFQKSLLEEMTFVYNNSEDNKEEQITIMELIARHRLAKEKKPGTEVNKEAITTEKIKEMFFEEGGKNTGENLNKLALMLLLGYKLEFAQKKQEQEKEQEKNRENDRLREKASEIELNQELRDIADLEYNEKISRLILNLHQNGKSEYTNAEAVAVTFLKDVLLKEKSQWEEAWKDFRQKLFQSNFYKDNHTVFNLVTDDFCILFRALWIYFSKHHLQYDKDDIMDKALDFYKELDDNKEQLTLEQLAILNTCEFEKRKYYLKTIAWFNDLEITGHFNKDSIYRDFLNKYTVAAYKHGYLRRYSLDLSYVPSKQDTEMNNQCVQRFLKDCKKNILQPTSSEFSEQIIEEINLVTGFYDKNLCLIQQENPASRKTFQLKVTTKSHVRHTEESIFEALEQEIKNGNFNNIQEKESFRRKLEEYYKKEKINLREYMELWGKINK